MSYRAVVLEDAKLDLDDIEEYLSQFYPSTARSFFKNLEKKVSMLEDMPYLYPEYQSDPFFRRMVVGDYLLFYSVEEEREQVIIHRVFHSARDVSQIILAKRKPN